MQEIRLQELPEDVPLGDMPRSIMTHLNRAMVNQLQPGNRIALIGIPVNHDVKTQGRDKNPNIQLSYLHGLGFVKGGELRMGTLLYCNLKM